MRILVVVLLSAIAAAACLGQDTNGRTYLKNPQTAQLNLPFADAVRVGDTLYISGRGGLDLETMRPPEDPREEAILLMEDFKQVLAAAGMSMDDLVSVTVYCPDIALYATFNDVYRGYFEGDFPARAFIGSGPLLFGMHFEMQGIAVR